MAKHEVRLSTEDFDGDRIPEVVVEFLKGGEVQYASFVTSSVKGGKLDKVRSSANVDGKKSIDKADENILLELANAFAKIKLK